MKSVSNRRTGGGRDGETIDEAKLRAASALRTCNRAVTAQDYEVIAGDAAGAAVRVHCVPPATPATLSGCSCCPMSPGTATGGCPSPP